MHAEDDTNAFIKIIAIIVIKKKCLVCEFHLKKKRGKREELFLFFLSLFLTFLDHFIFESQILSLTYYHMHILTENIIYQNFSKYC